MARPIKLQRIYVDTSVVGGCFDDEFQEHSLALFALARAESIRLVVSEVTMAELFAAPPHVRDVLAGLPEACLEYVWQTGESEALAEEYMRQAVVPARMIADAQHIATATVSRVDVLVSWNFKHIVNLNRIHAVNSVNLRAGYPMLEIRSPREVLENEHENF